MATPTLKPRIRFKTPALCHKSFLAPPDVPPGAVPPTVSGSAAWIDPDPLNPADFSATISGRLVNMPGIYLGQSPPGRDFFTFQFTLNPTTWLWEMILTLHGQRDPPEAHEFVQFAIDLTKSFDSGLRTEGPAEAVEFRQFRLRF